MSFDYLANLEELIGITKEVINSAVEEQNLSGSNFTTTDSKN